MELTAILALAFEYRFVLVASVGVIVFGLFEWDKTKVIVTENIFKARALAREVVLESGQEQEDWVVEHAWDIIPLPVKTALIPFGGKAMLRVIVKKLYALSKDALDNGHIDGSWIAVDAE